MTIFNYSVYKQDELDGFIRQAMGYTRMEFRDQYQWWDLEELLKTPADSWKEQVELVPSLKDVMLDARRRRKSSISKVSTDQNVPVATAARMVKTYIGFHPAYGAYLCQLGPYKSEGFWWGGEHVVGEAKGRFGYYVLRSARATPGEIGGALLSNINNYKKAYNVNLEPSDFELRIRAPKEKQDPKQKYDKWEDVQRPINLDPNNPEYRRVFNMDSPDDNMKGRGPMIMTGSFMTLNPKGYEKILRSFFGKYYDETIAQVARDVGKTTEEVVGQMMSDLSILQNVYTIALSKYSDAKAKGQVVETGQVPPPKFLDKTLQLAPGTGSIEFTKIQTSDRMIYQFDLTKEVLEYVEQGIMDPEQIAERLNADPQRVAFNNRRRQQNEARARTTPPQEQLPLISFTADEVQRHLDIIETQKEKLGEGATYANVRTAIDDLVKNTFSVEDPATGQKRGKYGYDDMKTAYQMAMLYFSSVPRDRKTKTLAGMPNAVAFNPPENLHNFTTQDLAKSKALKTLTKEEREAQPEELEKEIGPLPEAGKELKAPIREEEPLAEGEDPLAEMEAREDAKKEEEHNIEDIIGVTLKNLIKIAGELDKDGKDDSSEEIHKIIRKYQERVF